MTDSVFPGPVADDEVLEAPGVGDDPQWWDHLSRRAFWFAAGPPLTFTTAMILLFTPLAIILDILGIILEATLGVLGEPLVEMLGDELVGVVVIGLLSMIPYKALRWAVQVKRNAAEKLPRRRSTWAIVLAVPQLALCAMAGFGLLMAGLF